jgi:hypothetical protein
MSDVCEWMKIGDEVAVMDKFRYSSNIYLQKLESIMKYFITLLKTKPV